MHGVIERVYDDTKLANCFHMDLEPSESGEVIIAAIKHANESVAYALTPLVTARLPTASYAPRI